MKNVLAILICLVALVALVPPASACNYGGAVDVGVPAFSQVFAQSYPVVQQQVFAQRVYAQPLVQQQVFVQRQRVYRQPFVQQQVIVRQPLVRVGRLTVF